MMQRFSSEEDKYCPICDLELVTTTLDNVRVSSTHGINTISYTKFRCPKEINYTQGHGANIFYCHFYDYGNYEVLLINDNVLHFNFSKAVIQDGFAHIYNIIDFSKSRKKNLERIKICMIFK